MDRGFRRLVMLGSTTFTEDQQNQRHHRTFFSELSKIRESSKACFGTSLLQDQSLLLICHSLSIRLTEKVEFVQGARSAIHFRIQPLI